MTTPATTPDTVSKEIIREILAHAKVAAQAGALRLAMSKKEEAAKGAITALMQGHKLSVVEGKVTLNKINLTAVCEMKATQSSSVDIDKLTTMLTPEQFKKVAKVSLKDAKTELPQSLVDQCTFVSAGNDVLKIKLTGAPIPEVQFYR